ncbi:ATP-binding protein [Spirillospora sp. NPDC048911]|uniref:ATP-binding protein n=1 Tax=Spirillospora sp. NPDC048911 TaxID=3364527 RepID=UPI00371EE6C5
MGAMVVLGTIMADRRAASVESLRRYVEGTLGTAGVDAEDVRLVVSELGTNAVTHGSGDRMGLFVAADDECVRVEITDGGGGDPRERHAAAEDEGGRGLMIVTAIAEHWGVRRDEHGTTVWAEVARKPR